MPRGLRPMRGPRSRRVGGLVRPRSAGGRLWGMRRARCQLVSLPAQRGASCDEALRQQPKSRVTGRRAPKLPEPKAPARVESLAPSDRAPPRGPRCFPGAHSSPAALRPHLATPRIACPSRQPRRRAPRVCRVRLGPDLQGRRCTSESTCSGEEPEVAGGGGPASGHVQAESRGPPERPSRRAGAGGRARFVYGASSWRAGRVARGPLGRCVVLGCWGLESRSS